MPELPHAHSTETPKVLRVAVVTPMLPVPHDATRGRYIYETAVSLSKLAQVKVFFQQLRYPELPLLRPRSFLEGTVGEDYRIDGLDVEAFTYPGLPGLTRAVNGHISGAVLLPRLRAFAPDVVIGYWVYPDGFAAVRCARHLGVPALVGALGSDIHVRSGLNTRMTRLTIAQADRLVTVSEAMRQTAIREFGADPGRVHTVVNGFNTGVFHPRDRTQVRQRLGVAPEQRVVLYVGRFVEAKGMRELVAAMQQLCSQRPECRLVLVGTGVMQQELAGLIAQAGLSDRTTLPGGLEPAAVADWMSAADVVTLPSWSEGYPNVVVEGIACGTPVVATDVGGTREIITPDNGLLIPARDAQALHGALAEALDRSWDRQAIAASIRRTWDDVAAETLAVAELAIRAR